MFLDCIGSISWWVGFLEQEKLEVQLKHSFQKQSSLSQFRIMGPNGQNQLSIPTLKASRKGMYKDVEISAQEPWQLEHWRSLETAYLKSPFFIYYNYKIEPVFMEKYTHLIDFNKALLVCLLDCIKVADVLILDEQNDSNYLETKMLHLAEYPQVFDHKIPFIANLSIFDLLFNLGPEAFSYLKNHSVSVR